MRHFQIETETDCLIEMAHNIGEIAKKLICRNGFITETDSGKFWEVRNFKVIKKSHKENKRGVLRI